MDSSSQKTPTTLTVHLDVVLSDGHWRLQGGSRERLGSSDDAPDHGSRVEACTPGAIDQAGFRKLLDLAIQLLREKAATQIGQPVWTGTPAPDDKRFDISGDVVPQILFEVTRLFAPLRRKCDVAHWYYENVARAAGFGPGPAFQQHVRQFVGILAALKKAQERQQRDLRAHRGDAAGAAPTWATMPEADCLPEQAREALLEVCHGLGMVRYDRVAIEGAGPYKTPYVVWVPDPNVLVAKMFGLKTGIPGFDELLGGGLVLRGVAPALDHAPNDERPPGRGVLGVIRGRFGSGKSTLAGQLAFEAARKGAAGVLMVLEQSVEEVLAQAAHFGWLPPDPTFELFHDGRVYRDDGALASATDVREGRALEADQAFAAALRRRREGTDQTGALYLHHPPDGSLGRFEYTLDGLRRTLAEGLSPPAEAAGSRLRFVVVDPLDAVQLVEEQSEAQGRPAAYLRNRTEQILRDVTDAGVALFLTTADVNPDEQRSPYAFLPNIGDVVIRQSMVAAGVHHTTGATIAERPERLFEIEKARTQRFAKGVHPFEIGSRRGVQIYPSGDTFTRFVTWVDSSRPELERMAPSADADGDAPSNPVSLGHAALDVALGTGGVRPRSVTTLMGPTGCAKTELALCYLLRSFKLDDPSLDDESQPQSERSLFVAFRDTWESIEEILDGPVGRQLGYESDRIHRQRLDRVFDLLELKVGNVTSPWILEQVRRKFKEQPPGTRFTKVVIDSIAYMDLTSPLVRDDVLFVPNLLEILWREGVTPLFITSLVEGVMSESTVQTQIRDASHNLLALRRNRDRSHHFIALQVRKSQKLLHMPQPLEVKVEKRRDVPLPATFWPSVQAFLDGPHPSDRVPVKERLVELRQEILKGRGRPEALARAHRQRFELASKLHEAYVLLCDSFHLFPYTLVPPDEPRFEPAARTPAEEAEQAERTAKIAAAVARTKLPEMPDQEASEFPDEDTRRTENARTLARIATRRRVALEQQRPRELADWRSRYRDLMDALEVEEGITIRLHTLDDYDRPMGEEKLERTGAARAPRQAR